MEQERNLEVMQVTANRMGLVCRTKVELYYFLATECKLILYFLIRHIVPIKYVINGAYYMDFQCCVCWII